MRWTDSTLAVGAAISFFVPLLVVVRILFFGGFAGLDRPPGTVHPETTAVAQEEEPWRRNSEYVLDRAWDVDAPPQKRYFDWTISEISGNPDGIIVLLSRVFAAAKPGQVSLEVSSPSTLSSRALSSERTRTTSLLLTSTTRSLTRHRCTGMVSTRMGRTVWTVPSG